MHARIPRNVPIWLMLITRSYSASEVSTSGENDMTPALFTRTSSPPNACSTSRTVAAHACSSETSRWRYQALSPSWAVRYSPWSSSTSHSRVSAPSATNSRAAAAPWPRAAPVMIATLPCSRPAIRARRSTWSWHTTSCPSGPVAGPVAVLASHLAVPVGNDSPTARRAKPSGAVRVRKGPESRTRRDCQESRRVRCSQVRGRDDTRGPARPTGPGGVGPGFPRAVRRRRSRSAAAAPSPAS